MHLRSPSFLGLSQKTLSTLELFYTLIISRGNWGNIKNISQTRVNTDGAPGRICALWCQWQRLDIPMTNIHLRLHFLEHEWTKIYNLAYRNSTRALFRMKKLQKSDELKRAVEILNSYSLNSRGSLSLRTETSLVMTLWSYPSCFIKRQRLGSFPCVFTRKVILSYHKIFKSCYLTLLSKRLLGPTTRL